MNVNKWLVASSIVILLVSLSFVVNAQRRDRKKSGVYIEGREVTLEINGEKHVFTHKWKDGFTPDELGVFKDLNEHVVRYLKEQYRVKTEEELKAKLKSKGKNYKNEKERIYRGKEISPPRLRFYDEKGKMFKEIPLPWNDPRWNAWVSKDYKYGAVFNEDGLLEVYEASGEMLFSKKWDDRSVLWIPHPAIKMSDDGEMFAVICNVKYEGGGNSWVRQELNVLNGNGDKVFEFPNKDNKGSAESINGISPNGRFVSIYARGMLFGSESIIYRNLFFDLEEMAYYLMDEINGVRNIAISNEGMAKYTIYGPSKIEMDDDGLVIKHEFPHKEEIKINLMPRVTKLK